MNFHKAEFELAAGENHQFPLSNFPEVVFSGRSNVGKSSLINRLLNRKNLARVSATPGKTGTINFFRVDNCRFVDLPGYGYAKVSKSEKERWARLVDGYFTQDRNIALVIQLVDMRHGPTQDDQDMIDFLLEMGLPFAVALTKADKLNQTETAQQETYYRDLFAEAQIPVFPVSSVKGTGITELLNQIEKAINPTERI